ncbi:phosphotransferase [Longispora urticae]
MGDVAPAWFDPGWFEGISAALDDALDGRNLRRTGPVTSVKHWSMSTVLRVPTDGGDVYLKAVLPWLSHEPRVIAFLARRRPRGVPEILAVGDGWWLTTDFGGTDARSLPELDRTGAPLALAEVQRATATDLAGLRDAGCPVLSAADLADRIPALLARDDLWGAAPNRPRALDRDEHRRLRALEPALLACCEQLAAGPLPDTVTHGDFHPGNAVARAGGFLIHDWSFAAIGHPLFDLAAFLHDASGTAAAEYVDRVLDAWLDHAPRPVLDRCWQAAKPLGAVVEILKFTALADATGPAHEDSWLPMVHGWARRLLRADEGAGWP